MEKRFTPENIQELRENEIFVFGSNLNGNHAGGAARLAVEKFGAIMGQAEGLQGQSYAIPTLDKNMRKVNEEDLIISLGKFRNFAVNNDDKTFLLTEIGTGIAGFDANYMAYMILRAKLPKNVIIPKIFSKIKGYKGFNPDMTCRDFKYEEGKEYKEQGDIKACNKGFHFCLHPLDVFEYYPPALGVMNKFHEVEGGGDIPDYANWALQTKNGERHFSHIGRVISDYNIKCLCRFYFRLDCIAENGKEFQQPYFTGRQEEATKEVKL